MGRADGRRQGGRWRVTAGTILALSVAAGCGDTAPLGPPDELAIEAVTPLPFRAGLQVTVTGPGVDRAELFLDGTPLEILTSSAGRAVFRAPDQLPACTGEQFAHTLSATGGGLSASSAVRSLGRPTTVALSVGDHVVLPEVALGCALALPAGTYGAAVYRTASPGTDPLQRRRGLTTRTTVDLVLGDRWVTETPAGAGLASLQAFSAPPLAGAPDLPRPAGVAEAAPGPDGCVPELLAPGDGLELTIPWGVDSGPYEVVSTSPRIQVLVFADSLERYASARRDRAEGLAGTLEGEVVPFLAEVFGGWPDTDGDGRLGVVVTNVDGGLYPGGRGLRADGCDGDFVMVAHWLLDIPPDERQTVETVVAHEATHWFDLGPDLAAQARRPEWSVEGFPSLVSRLWRERREGLDFWRNAAPCEGRCARWFLEELRYGAPGLAHPSYVNGGTLLRYLLQEISEPGTLALSGLAGLRHRPGELGLEGAFAAMGGRGRTEAELQGELLLSFYADDFVEGVSARLTQASWDLSWPMSEPLYPMRRAVLDAAGPTWSVELGLPDGVVVELRPEVPSVLSVVGATTRTVVALVRAR